MAKKSLDKRLRELIDRNSAGIKEQEGVNSDVDEGADTVALEIDNLVSRLSAIVLSFKRANENLIQVTEKFDRRCKNRPWSAFVWIDHTDSVEEDAFTITFDSRGAQIIDYGDGRMLWPKEDKGKSSDSNLQCDETVKKRWSDCIEYLQSDFLEEIAVLIADAERKQSKLMETHGTRDHGATYGRRWATFSSDTLRRVFVRKLNVPREDRPLYWDDASELGRVLLGDEDNFLEDDKICRKLPRQ